MSLFFLLHFWDIFHVYFQSQNIGFSMQAEVIEQEAGITKLERSHLLLKNHSRGNKLCKPNQLVLQEVTRPAPLKLKHLNNKL